MSLSFLSGVGWMARLKQEQYFIKKCPLPILNEAVGFSTKLLDHVNKVVASVFG